MKVQKSNLDNTSTLYLVPTPIGNFDDMTFRSVDVLKNVDIIYCEDTRVTKVLLSHFNINTPLKSYHIFNENSRCDEVLNNLKNGLNVALVSDAGLPCISDPGFLISKYVIENDYNVFEDKNLMDGFRIQILELLSDKGFTGKNVPGSVINDLIDEVCYGYDLSNGERACLFNLIDGEVNGFGPITYLMKDDNITEIMVNSPSEIYIEVDGVLRRENNISFVKSYKFLCM